VRHKILNREINGVGACCLVGRANESTSVLLLKSIPLMVTVPDVLR